MNPTYEEIVAAATCKTTTVNEWTDGQTLTTVKHELNSPSLSPASERLVWTIDDRYLGLAVGAQCAITSVEIKSALWDGEEGKQQNNDTTAAVFGRKIRKNGTVELTEHFLGHVITKVRAR